MANIALRGTSNLINTIPKRFASAAAAQDRSSSSQPRTNEPIRVTRLDNGVVLASLENYSPITRIGAVFNTGARDETSSERGVTHALRVFSSLATRNYSAYGLSRHLDQIGANLSVTASRENVNYLLETTRQHTQRGADILGEILSRPEFRHWEINDAKPRLGFDLDVYDERVDLQLADLIHRASFADGLSNSLFAPRYNAGNLNGEVLEQFRRRTFTSDRLTIVGLGLRHDDLLRYAEFFRLPAAETSLVRADSRFLPVEIRQENNNDLVYLALSSQGASLSSSNDVLVAALVSQAFGQPGQRIKYSSSTRLNRALLPLASQPASVSSFNLNYTDAGLFGFQVIANKNDAGKLTTGVVNELQSAAKNGLSATELTAAKNALKFQLSESVENSHSLIELIAQNREQADAKTNIADLLQAVDAVSSSDVNSFIKRIAGSRLSLAAIGDLSTVPRLADLSA